MMGKRRRKVSQTITRPADVTAYAAGDVISAVTSNDHFTFADIVEAGELSALIETALLIDSANVATKPDLELWLFDTDIAEVADNGAFAPTDAEMLTLLGIILFPTANFVVGTATAGADGNSVCQTLPGLAVKCAPLTGRDIYGQLVVRNAYVPVASEQFTVELTLALD